MATITVEDGTGLNNSTSYVSESYLETYANDRNITLSYDSDILLIKGMDVLESMNFTGDKASQSQALQYPRINVVIDGYLITSTTIPAPLMQGLCELCIGIDQGNDPNAPQTRETKREKVGDIEVEYMDNARASTYLRAADAKLRKLMNDSVTVIRG